MHFGFDSEQVAFRDAVRDLLDKDCTPEAVREAWAAPPGQLDRTVWDHLTQMGVPGVLVPVAEGGLGLDERSLALILEETGRAALPHPLVETAVVAAPLLGGRVASGAMVASDLGGPNVADAADADLLLLTDAAMATATGPDTGRAGDTTTATTTTTAPDTATTDGRPPPTAQAEPNRTGAATTDGRPPPTAQAERSGTRPAVAGGSDWHRPAEWPGRALYLVEPGGMHHSPLDTVDGGRRAARVRCAPDQARLLTDDPEVVSLAFDRGAWGTAAQLVGLAQRMLDLTVAYVGEREQFGQRIGAFQAVKHHLADALKELAFARPAVHRAAHSLATDAPTRTRDVAMAKAMASDAAWFVARQALQCHGAIGYTVEADLHLYLKRTWALAKAWGDAAWHRHRVRVALGV